MLLEEMMRNVKREGKLEGKLEGNAEGKQECLLSVLKSKFSVSDELKEKIVNITVRQSRQSGVARATCPD